MSQVNQIGGGGGGGGGGVDFGFLDLFCFFCQFVCS